MTIYSSERAGEAGRTATVAERDTKILSALNECGEDFAFLSFRTLSSRTGIDRRQVRLDVRRMARKGWTQYGRGLWTDDGEMAGSGYAITDAGRAALQAQGDER